jgi:hypothetical protein
LASKINLTYDDNVYTLEFTRRTVAIMENQGFEPEKLISKPMSMLPMLFRGAFFANHPNTKHKLIDTIFEKVSNKENLLAQLADMYRDTLYSLWDEKEDGEGNATWEEA